MQYHDFSDFNERYLQFDSPYDIIPIIEKGVAATGLKPGMCFGQWYILASARYQNKYSRYEVNSKTFILGQRATVWNKSLFLFYKEWSSVKREIVTGFSFTQKTKKAGEPRC